MSIIEVNCWIIDNYMDIESEYRKRRILKAGGDYNLEWCRWRVMGPQNKKKKEIFNPNPKGYIHGALILKTTLYAFFGPDQNRPTAVSFPKTQSMHSYSFKSYEWKEWADCNLPPARDSFGLTVYQNEIFLYGGSSYDTQYGDLHAFNTLTCTWRPLETTIVPSPRNPLIFADIGEAILLYGGINVESGIILNDGFFFDGQEWLPAEGILGAPNNLVGAKFAMCRSTAYLFGGERQNENGLMVPNTILYTLRANIQEKTLTFSAQRFSGRAPCARTAHGMATVGDFVVVVGGQSVPQNRMLRDIWLLDVDNLDWVKVDPANGPIKPLADNTLLLHGSVLLVMGGLTEHDNMWNQQILALEFGESEPYRNEICSNCLQRTAIREKAEKAFPKTVVISSGFFYTISLEIKHPFQAVQLLYDCATYLNASYFNISIQKSLNENEHIQVEFDGRSLSKTQFQDLICHSNTAEEDFSRFVSMLKVASLRLGKTLIFITADQAERKVFMFSADSKVAPAFDETYGFFAYIENIRKGSVESHEGKGHKELILNVLRSRIATPEQALTVTNCTRLLIFEKNILVTSDRVYYYELIPTIDDISVYKSSKKVQFLDQLGYQISKDPELSLRNYLSLLSLRPAAPTLSIARRQAIVQPTDYLVRLRGMEGQGLIVSFEMPSKIHDIELQCVLYIAQSESVVAGNLGLLVYHQNRLVNRLGDYFGELFKEQFYKTKFRKAVTIFEYLGVINIRKGLSLSYFGNWFKKNRNYYSFLESLKTAMRKAKLDKLERHPENEDTKAKRRL